MKLHITAQSTQPWHVNIPILHIHMDPPYAHQSFVVYIYNVAHNGAARPCLYAWTSYVLEYACVYKTITYSQRIFNAQLTGLCRDGNQRDSANIGADHCLPLGRRSADYPTTLLELLYSVGRDIPREFTPFTMEGPLLRGNESIVS